MSSIPPPSPVSRILSATALEIICVAALGVLLVVVGFSLIWDEIHGTAPSSVTTGLLSFLLGVVSSIISIHVGSGVNSAGTSQGITSIINPASLTVDATGRPNGKHEAIHTTQTSTVSAAPPGASSVVTESVQEAQGA